MLHRLKNIILGITVEITFALLIIAIGYLLGTSISLMSQ